MERRSCQGPDCNSRHQRGKHGGNRQSSAPSRGWPHSIIGWFAKQRGHICTAAALGHLPNLGGAGAGPDRFAVHVITQCLISGAILHGDLFRQPSPARRNGFVDPEYGFIRMRITKRAANRTRNRLTNRCSKRPSWWEKWRSRQKAGIADYQQPLYPNRLIMSRPEIV
jgi:hypothetical protein